ncbi:UDP-N-acetylmuramoyl-tripeptide--D-alanyl-D-alanine ligase [Sphingobium sp. CR2-8]|uniref:UDP-N-acetylmuramoyl-tripeptide--D-alanyl-D- alanine ligase n=1 Tax=Sphingobium sp. CR2-8 TaxID=1306534 RepID=UPI002DB68362|nr:UDP-N-acetylmuramoyl-tripeptide--D-alanyl-D-alanine ligase [Sphingobium sp. CR2-8]MEC3910177.1 UDP-N-acetylmuramoyl-tripeptide--D-alanyl-D-alanine ligase [Sphingobium sp. CR2-8]
MNAMIDQKLSAIAEKVAQAPSVTIDGAPRTILFLSFTDGTARARTITLSGPDGSSCWRSAVPILMAAADQLRWLRVDWVRAVEQSDWRSLRQRLGATKRNYFRLGIALDARLERAFLETEINANAMFYGGQGHPTAIVNEGNIRRYARLRHCAGAIDFGDDAPVWLFSTGGLFMGEDGVVHTIGGQGRNAGRRTVDRLDPDLLLRLIDDGSAYLASQVRADGRFHYGWHPCFDREIAAYNSLRHASSTYAMLESWEVTRDPDLLAAIERALTYLERVLIASVDLPNGTPAAFLIDPGNEIKLGGNAVCLLALVKYSELMATDRYRVLLDRLATGILYMQDAATGRFVHVLDYPTLAVKQEFRIIYYDGEAAFGLMRLYGLTRDPRWIAAVTLAFDHFIAAGHASAHDHWLGYCANELTRHQPSETWYRFGLDTIRDYLDFVERRITTFPTLLELMMAAQHMIARLAADPDHSHLLDSIDLVHFDRALHARAHYLLNGHFWPELAMFFANPRRIVGSFFIRHHGFRVRIDDVEHYLSGLIAYRRHLLDRQVQAPVSPPESGWTARSVAQATGGRWIAPPPADWSAQGLCIFPLSQRPGDMVVVRGREGERGIAPRAIDSVKPRASAIITSAPERFAASGLPVLAVQDNDDAILALGRYARAAMTGKLIGVTGSAGKTTMVAMLARALRPWGDVGETRLNANLPHGIGWNLASIPWNTPHIVMELAIGRMRQNAMLTRPDIAVFTNIAAAHLEYHHDLTTVARRKSAIFQGMAPGGVAILNADMQQLASVRALAQARDLSVVTYGLSPEADFRLIDRREGAIMVQTPGGALHYRLAAPGQHMVLNSVAVLATLSVLSLDAGRGLDALADFRPLAGRGEELALTIEGRRLCLIDDAYNANPESMAAALALLGARRGRRRVAVLGEMLELGPEATRYHSALEPLIHAHGIDRVHVVGKHYAQLWAGLPRARRGLYADDVGQLRTCLKDMIEDDDVLLIKGSHGSAVHQLVDQLKADARQIS